MTPATSTNMPTIAVALNPTGERWIFWELPVNAPGHPQLQRIGFFAKCRKPAYEKPKTALVVLRQNTTRLLPVIFPDYP